jgi:hypothetical protein
MILLVLVVEDLVANNCDCHVNVGGDFNVDFSADRLQTALLNSLCDNLGLYAVMRHYKSTIGYSYNFNLDRFNILDHFLLSSTMFDNLIDYAYAMHDVDNTSDHQPIIIKHLMDSKYAGFSDRTYSSHISWPKATDSNIRDYRCAMSYNFEGITLPIDMLVCQRSDEITTSL